jgi:hypothetical protein
LGWFKNVVAELAWFGRWEYFKFVDSPLHSKRRGMAALRPGAFFYFK